MIRRAPTIALCAFLAFGLADCSSDAKKSASSTTSSNNSTTTTQATTTTTSEVTITTTTSAPVDATTPTAKTTTTTTKATPVDNETFAQIIDEAQANLDAASSACDLRLIMDSLAAIPEPSTSGQVKLAVEFVGPLYTAIADTAPPEHGEAWRASGTKLREVAEASNYDPAVLNDDELLGPTPGFSEAATAFTTATNECRGATP